VRRSDHRPHGANAAASLYTEVAQPTVNAVTSDTGPIVDGDHLPFPAAGAGIPMVVMERQQQPD
jgi:hypothetical protein